VNAWVRVSRRVRSNDCGAPPLWLHVPERAKRCIRPSGSEEKGVIKENKGMR